MIVKYYHRIRNYLFGDAVDKTIVAVHQGCKRKFTKLCFFASFDQNSSVSPFVLAYLKELKRCGFDIVFCVTSEVLREDCLPELKGLCFKIIHRQNLGYDFASWRSCFSVVEDMDDVESLLITNDSVLGPLSSLKPLFRIMDSTKSAVWAMNDSIERAYHLQSFFMYFSKQILESRSFKDFWLDVRIIDDKFALIKEFEIGLSSALNAAGFELKALFPLSEVKKRCADLGDEFQYPQMLGSSKCNPTLYCWYELVTYFSYPFVKSDVIKNNRYHSRHYGMLMDILSEIGSPVNRSSIGLLLGSRLKQEKVV
jgi:hypothetical protein